MEKGEKVRIDATPVESEIHHPTDNQLLCDCVRVLAVGWDDFLVLSTSLTGIIACGPAADVWPSAMPAVRPCASALIAILLKVSRKMAGYTRTALVACEDSSHPRVVRVRSLLEHYLELTDRVIDQTERRVLRGESVPAGQKVVSIFEEHTDLIRKRRPGNGLWTQSFSILWQLLSDPGLSAGAGQPGR